MLLSGSKSFSKNKNIYSWNQISNMLFFESPAGVGYSVNNDKSYIFTDPRTAQDGLAALNLFYKRFPEFKPNKFWIAG
jgi:carboxypeptidase C (cathepsin A)